MTVAAIRRALPPTAALWACAASATLHAVVLVLAARIPAPVSEEAFEPIRIVMVDPPPPPLGLPEGEAEAPPAPAPAAAAAPRPGTARPDPKPPARPTPAREPSAPAAPAVLASAPAEPAPAPSAAPRGRPEGERRGVAGGIGGGRGDEPLPAGKVALPPRILVRVPPEYPWQARSRGLEGEVVIEAIVDRRGRIEEDVEVLRSVPGLDEAALDAVRRWRFRPARDERDRPVRVIVEIPIRFVLR